MADLVIETEIICAESGNEINLQIKRLDNDLLEIWIAGKLKYRMTKENLYSTIENVKTYL